MQFQFQTWSKGQILEDGNGDIAILHIPLQDYLDLLASGEPNDGFTLIVQRAS